MHKLYPDHLPLVRGGGGEEENSAILSSIISKNNAQKDIKLSLKLP